MKEPNLSAQASIPKNSKYASTAEQQKLTETVFSIGWERIELLKETTW